MKNVMRRIGAILLTIAMFATMLPAVSAANVLTTSVTGLTASWEYSNQGGGSATWTSGGTSISAETKGTAAKTNISDLTLTNNSGAEAVLSFNWSLTTGGTTAANRASLTGAIAVSNKASASGEFSQTLADGESIIIQLKSPRGAAYKGTFVITDLALVGLNQADPILTFKPAIEGGSYTLDGAAVTADVTKEVAIRTELMLSATAEEGYIFYGWYDSISQKYLSQDTTFKLVASADANVTAVFVSDSVALFGVGTAKYDNLTDAANAADKSTTHKTVILLNDGTITGDHVIPAGVTLLIPYDDANTAHGNVPACTSSDGNSVKWVTPYAYRTLTLAADATITVNGALEVGGRHAAAGGSAGMYAAPTDALGYIYMTAGSHIEVNGDLYAWGYVYGEGTVTANEGAGIYEVFQVTDFRGGNATLALAGDYLVFPMTQYYVQNVEVATTYHYGATAYVTTTMFVSSQCVTAPPIKFIGAGAMFQPGEGSYIIKEYDPVTDTLNLDAYGDCALSTMTVSLAGNTVDTTNFVLPITNNINIYIHEGTATLKQDIAMLPGSTLTVGSEAVLEIGTAETPTAAMTAGYNLIVYDSENWTSGLNYFTFENEEDLTFVHPSNLLVPVKYSPSEHKVRTDADIKDVVFDINGLVVADGYLYSTVTWADALNEDFSIVSGGASVISSEGTGVVCLNSGAGADLLTYQYDQIKDTAYKSSPDYDAENGGTLYYMIPLAAIQLQNGDGSLLDTTGAEPGAIYTYCDNHDHWIAGEECALPVNVEITWVVNGASETADVAYGTVPTYPETPVKALDNNYHYVFAGWSATEGGAVIDLPAAENAATYYAVFTSVAHTYGTAAVEGKHSCVCGKVASCSDADNDGDHLCDLGCGDAKSEHVGGTATCDKLAVCTECGESYGTLKAHAWVDASCDNPKYCSVCGETEGDVAHGNIVHVAAKDATCSEQGNIEYWYCEACGQAWLDEACTLNTNLMAVKLPMVDHEYFYPCDPVCMNCGEVTNPDAAHSVKHVEAKAATCYENGNVEYWYCEACGQAWLDEACTLNTNLMAVVLPMAHAEATHVEAKAPTCYENGNIEYWYCEACGQAWLDEACTLNTNLLAVILPMGHGTITHVAAKDATCYENGNIEYWYCEACGQAWLDEACTLNTNLLAVILPMGHGTITHVAAKDATCYENGNIEYWYCEACGQAWLDEACTLNTNLLAVILPMGHGTITHVAAKDATCYENGNIEYWYCEACGQAWLDEACTLNTNLLAVVLPMGHGTITHVAAKDATCYENGNIEYWYCEACGQAWLDEACTLNTNLLAVILPMGHGTITHVAAKDATCYENGNIEYWYCEACGQAWLDEACTLNTNMMAVKLPMAEHSHDDVQLVLPTTTSAGYYRYTCSACGNDYYDVALNTGWFNNNGDWYYLDAETGYAVSGCVRVPYPSEAMNGITYAPNAEDLAYWEAHQATSQYTDLETAVFVFGEDGKFNAITGQIGDSYAVNGMIAWHVGLVEINGEYYYFKGDVNGGGNVMVSDATLYISRNTTDLPLINGYYTFAADGKLCRYDGITEIDGELYYYENYRLAKNAGLIYVDGDYYYVRANGKLVVDGKYWIANSNGYDIAAGHYTFNEDGKLQLNTGIVEENGAYYYYIDGIKQIGAGVVELVDETGATYYIYVRSNGQLATGQYWPTVRNGLLERGSYDWGTDGKYYPSTEIPVLKNGIYEENGAYYYYVDDVKQIGVGVVELVDETGATYYIYVRSNGQLATGIYWPTVRNDLLSRGAYDWGTDGKYYPAN